MYSPGNKTPRVGRVSIDIHGKSYRLRFTYPEGVNHSFTIARATEEGWATATKAALIINRDIDLGDFDDTYARYSPRHAKKLEKQQGKKAKKYNLLELWLMYKEDNRGRVAKTTQNNLWKLCDRLLKKIDYRALELKEANLFVKSSLEIYAASTMHTLFRTCIDPCVNLAVRKKLIEDNPYQIISLPKMQKKRIQCYEPEEVRAIIHAFYSDKYTADKSRYPDSYYAPMVEILALTGCRPEEIHALTWDDIKHGKNKTQIIIRKVYSNGVFMEGTKNKVDRIFPCNKQLANLINRIPKIENEHNLVFPSPKGKYITQRNFRCRFWDKITNSLVAEGLISKRLKPYCLRHSFITRLIREGVDIATVASLSGNSPRMIMDNYLASNDKFDLPEL